MDNGNPDLVLQRVEVVLHSVFRLAHIDHDLRIGCGNGFLVEVALATVNLTENIERRIFATQVFCLIVRNFSCKADHLLGSDRQKHVLCERTGSRHAIDLRGKLHFPSERVREGARCRRLGLRIAFLVAWLLLPTGTPGKREGERERHRSRRDCESDAAFLRHLHSSSYNPILP